VANAATAPATPSAAPAPRGRVTALPTPFASFPVPGTVPVTLYPSAGGRGIASLSYTAARTGTESLIDDVAFSGSALASVPTSANRLLYATPVFRDTVHLSGTPRVTLRVAANVKAANLSVWLVMLPYDSARAGSQSYKGSVSHGWADLQNAKSLTSGGEYTSAKRGTPLQAGEYREVTFDLEPTDEFIPAGKQLAVMIMSSDREFTLWPKAWAELTLDLAKSRFLLPIVGGTAALQNAGMR
jgi:X-Pro dipeptidyl-peptidase